MSDEAQRKVHEALGLFLDEGEIAVSWVLTIDVAGQDGQRYLAHRAGGGADGTDNPMAWVALGMMEGSAAVARDQLLGSTGEIDDEDEASE